MTGHTADDQAETVLLRLLRGTGPTGLAAMRPGPAHPILALRRRETEELCACLGLQPVADDSNSDPTIRRNRVRAELLPLIADISDRDPVPVLARIAEVAAAEGAFLDGQIAGIDPTDCRAVRACEPVLARRAIRRWLADETGYPPSTEALERVMRVVDGTVIACEIAGGIRVSRSSGRLHLTSLPGSTD